MSVEVEIEVHGSWGPVEGFLCISRALFFPLTAVSVRWGWNCRFPFSLPCTSGAAILFAGFLFSLVWIPQDG